MHQDVVINTDDKHDKGQRWNPLRLLVLPKAAAAAAAVVAMMRRSRLLCLFNHLEKNVQVQPGLLGHPCERKLKVSVNLLRLLPPLPPPPPLPRQTWQLM
jgi:hypothetical protein